jgi:hypothetical protein
MQTDGGSGFPAWLLVAIGGFGVMVLFLRWTFSSGHSLIARRPKQGHEDEYGLLVPVSSPSTYIEGEQQRLKLEESGIRGSLVSTTDGVRLMVFEQDASIAREILRS